MKFSNKSLTKHIKGACYYETERGYLLPYHYSKAQFDFFVRLREFYKDAPILAVLPL